MLREHEAAGSNPAFPTTKLSGEPVRFGPAFLRFNLSFRNRHSISHHTPHARFHNERIAMQNNTCRFAQFIIACIVLLIALRVPAAAFSSVTACMECHPAYCQAWESTRHGKSLMPYSPELAASMLTHQVEDIAIGSFLYRFNSNEQDGWIEERSDSSQSHYKISFMLGGKNMLIFLTPLEKGRMQILPLAYNIGQKKWFDNSAGSLPHGMPQASGQSNWKSRSNLFNTSCFACHINSPAAYYSIHTDTYQPLGDEHGISCHSCHGPVDEHVRICRAASAGQTPDDLKISIFQKCIT